MASANSLKEPSMDEILASIRRIIESGDERNGADQGSARNTAQSSRAASGLPPAASPSQTSDPVSHGIGEVPRFDVHYLNIAPNAVVLPVEDRQDGRAAGGLDGSVGSASAAPEVNEVSAGYARQPEGVEADEAFAVFADGALPPDDRPTAAPMPGNENFVQSPASVDAANAAALPHDGFNFDERLFEAELSEERWSAEAPSAIGTALPEAESRLASPAESRASRPMPESVIDGASALLSAEAGDQVASAFGDLARAIREGQMRSMEQMAREMLRPMLQEWLDDNLPRIVERLVREEIERVARGARY